MTPYKIGTALESVAGGWADPRLAEVPVWTRALTSLEAIRLTQLGARAGLICQLTGIERATANRLYRQIHHCPSPPGQTPFTDTWFLKNDQRMLHAAIVWRFHRRLNTNPNRPARRLINAYESYRVAVKQPVLDITHAAFVPRLVEMGLWRERACSRCTATYLDSIEILGSLCPGCRLHQRFRCPSCGARAEGLRRGRRRKTCPHCGTLRASDAP